MVKVDVLHVKTGFLKVTWYKGIHSQIGSILLWQRLPDYSHRRPICYMIVLHAHKHDSFPTKTTNKDNA